MFETVPVRGFRSFGVEGKLRYVSGVLDLYPGELTNKGLGFRV